MAKAFRVSKFYRVSNLRQANLRQQKLVPIYEESPDKPISESDVYLPKHGDWLIEYYDADHSLNLMKVEGYQHLQHKHLYIKHFIKVSHTFNVDLSQVSHLFMIEVQNTEHLSEFSEEAVYSLLNYFERQIKVQEKQKISKIKTPGETRKRKPKSELKYATRWPRPQSLKLNDRFRKNTSNSIVLADKKRQPNIPNSKIELDKKSWAIFNQRFPGQQPKKGQIVDIRKEILKEENKI